MRFGCELTPGEIISHNPLRPPIIGVAEPDTRKACGIILLLLFIAVSLTAIYIMHGEKRCKNSLTMQDTG